MYYQKKVFLLEYSMEKEYERLSNLLHYLEKTIDNRNKIFDQKSYTSNLLKKGVDRISQKIGEEAVEVVIAANNNNKKNLIDESADLIFHLMILWKKKKITLLEIAEELESRQND